LYAIGLVLQSATCVILFRLEVAQIGDLALLGVFCGSAAGIYWANRNLLSLQVTKGPLRDYFCGLESAIGTLLSVLSPLFCGWFLDFGLKTEGWSVVERYRFLAFVALIIQCVGAWYIVSARFEDYSPKSILALRASALWNRARLFTAVKGVAEGSGMFIPTLVVLRLVGEEGTVGSTQSLAMVFTTAALYIIASKMRFENRLRVLQLGVSSMILGAICLSCFYSGLGALSYLFLQTLAVQLLWVAANPIILDAINVDQKDSTDYYRYIVDRELCLNLGRVLGVCVVLSLCLFTSADITLRLAPLILALVTGLLLIISKGL